MGKGKQEIWLCGSVQRKDFDIRKRNPWKQFFKNFQDVMIKSRVYSKMYVHHDFVTSLFKLSYL